MTWWIKKFFGFAVFPWFWEQIEMQIDANYAKVIETIFLLHFFNICILPRGGEEEEEEEEKLIGSIYLLTICNSRNNFDVNLTQWKFLFAHEWICGGKFSKVIKSPIEKRVSMWGNEVVNINLWLIIERKFVCNFHTRKTLPASLII